jgi:hypothetical protein
LTIQVPSAVVRCGHRAFPERSRGGEEDTMTTPTTAEVGHASRESTVAKMDESETGWGRSA